MDTKERFENVIDDILTNLDEHYTDHLDCLNRHQFDELCHLAEALKHASKAYSHYMRACAYEKMMDVPNLMSRLEGMAENAGKVAGMMK